MSVNGLRGNSLAVCASEILEVRLPLKLERDDIHNVYVGSDEQASGTLVPKMARVSRVNNNVVYMRQEGT